MGLDSAYDFPLALGAEPPEVVHSALPGVLPEVGSPEAVLKVAPEVEPLGVELPSGAVLLGVVPSGVVPSLAAVPLEASGTENGALPQPEEESSALASVSGLGVSGEGAR